MGLREGRTSQGGRRTPLGPAVHPIKRDDPVHVPAGTSSKRSRANTSRQGGLSCHSVSPVEELTGPQHGPFQSRTTTFPRALAPSAAAANPRLPWWALLAVLIPLILTAGLIVCALLTV